MNRDAKGSARRAGGEWGCAWRRSGGALLAMIAAVASSFDAAHAQEQELGEVKVTGPRTPSAVIPTLQDEIVRTERFTTRDIQQTNASNVNEAIDKNPGISVQVECSICNVRNIVLNNLPGRYTTLLIDGIPLFSSVSGAYGFDMVLTAPTFAEGMPGIVAAFTTDIPRARSPV
jgi:outer membrane cobalamin receptor